MASWGLMGDLIVIFLAAGVGGLIARRFRQPIITGYLLTGFLMSVLLRGIIPISGALELADIGLAFLMFTVGLDFSFRRLTRVRAIAVFGGILQIAICAVLVGLLGNFSHLGLNSTESLIIGLVFSLSSTAIVVKVLSERGELDTLPSEIAVGMLLVQDLAVVPILVMVNQLSLPNSGGFIGQLGAILLAVIKSGILVYLVLILGKKIVPRVIGIVASANSREILLMSIVCLVLIFSAATSYFGLSFALGAFLAGMLIAETASSHAVFSEIRPLRDVFAVVFFTTLGFLVSPDFVFSQWGTILKFALLVITTKFFVVWAITLYFKFHLKTAIQVGLALTSVGEFAFIVGRVCLSTGLISANAYSLILAVTIVSMFVAPWQIHLSVGIFERLKKMAFRWSPKLHDKVFKGFDQRRGGSLADTKVFSEHVVICGHGRVGRHITRILSLASVPFVVVDYNHQVISELKEMGIEAILGDPSDREVLIVAGVKNAVAVVVAVPDRYSQELIIQNALSLHSGVTVVCRSHFDEDRGRLFALGATTVISPEFEAGLSMGHRVLDSLGLDKDRIATFLRQARKEMT